MVKKIEDFGEKIGGARKDLWSSRGMNLDDIVEMNDDEKDYYINRDMIWPIPNSKKLVEDGLDVFIAFWQREIRKCIRKYPLYLNGDIKEEVQIGYVDIVSKIRDAAMNISKKEELKDFYIQMESSLGNPGLFRRSTYRLMETKYQFGKMKNAMTRRNFPYGNRNPEKEFKSKPNFCFPYLNEIQREGPNVRRGNNINAEQWQNEFSFRGVEFGNWVTQKERQLSMNYCYEALFDLAEALNISNEDIAFSGKLALAFGARGRSGASAHYEYLRRVINLTKLHGAGCTAHEWGHALDHQIAIFYGIKDSFLASVSKEQYKLPGVLRKLLKSMSKDADGNDTNFLIGSIKLDFSYRKDRYGYWSSRQEMFARAFACYVKDTLNRKSDYLIAHADCYICQYENQIYSATPQGKEREILNELFEQVIVKLKEDGLLHERVIKEIKQIPIYPSMNYNNTLTLSEDIFGQISFFL